MSSQTCPNCGWLNRATNRFCSNCGSAIVPSTPAPTESAPAVGSTLDEPSAGAASTLAPTSPADTQPVTYAVKRWDPTSAEPEPSQPFTPPAVQSDPSAPTLPIAPPPVPPGAHTYGSVESNTVAFGPPPAIPSPAKSDGGTYVPYSTDAARRLESGKTSRSWLLPAIVVAALLLLVVGGVSGFLFLNGQRAGTPVANTPTQAPLAQQIPCSDLLSKLESGGSGADEQDTLRAIICQSNNEQITAWRELDTEILKGTRTGQALDENIQAVQDLRSKGMYAVPDNKSLEFGEVAIKGDTATAKTVEVWTVVFYSKSDNRIVQSQGPDTLRETYHFIKVDGKWLITSVDIVPNSPPITPGTSDT